MPLVVAGDRVRAGDPVADVAEGQVGARIHASIDGTVQSVGEAIVIDAVFGGGARCL